MLRLFSSTTVVFRVKLYLLYPVTVQEGKPRRKVTSMKMDPVRLFSSIYKSMLICRRDQEGRSKG